MWGALEKEGPGEELEDLRRRYEPVCLKYWPRWTSQSLQGTLLPDLMSQAHPAATVGPWRSLQEAVASGWSLPLRCTAWQLVVLLGPPLAAGPLVGKKSWAQSRGA